jgi:hypothetical protein
MVRGAARAVNTAATGGRRHGRRAILFASKGALVFVPSAACYLKEPLRLDCAWASLRVLAAVYFVFRGKLAAE